ncbi:uncharacterized protein K460DRAFT_276289 [Cucurbitaria berberidis CBS 394.84]|uniref:Uncharacterized protein n=1 Tax=Cucurbitaria berberidis CBS 394.84 TaxID=1168544 RepID=A0A9P4GMV7_9PLEO|nr:uncharacterized protein K460DRAFT_276289 [Cucurbitaria berberidis CBS 394.84]KAF1848112.1 hypothetical protein K460DRAFT_276289 [Cucurbitaria berberidis CBS 394.84]
MFRISSSVTSDLRSALSSFTSSRISRFIALATLLWEQIIFARCAMLISQGYPRTTLAVVVDLRKHCGAPFTAPDCLGNFVLSAKPTWPLPIVSSFRFPRIVNAQHLAPFAQCISHSLQSIDRAWVTNRLAYIASSAPPLIDTHELTFSNGPDLYITSWEHMGADCEWDIPGTGSAKPTALRRAAWVSEGGIVVLPRQQDGDAPYEVLVSLAEEDMMRLQKGMQDGGWLTDESSKAFKARL